MLRIMYVLMSEPSSLVHVHLVFSGRTLLYVVNDSAFGSLSGDSASFRLGQTVTTLSISLHITDDLQW